MNEKLKNSGMKRKCIVCGKEFVLNAHNQTRCFNCSKSARYSYSRTEGIVAELKPAYKSHMPPVETSKRWEVMNLNERSKECRKYHLTYGQAQTMAYNGTLPEDFGVTTEVKR